jgi:cytidylate kinase
MHSMNPALPFHITISRQLGSGGSELGERIARRMKFAFMDRQILDHACQELGMSEEELGHREERIQGFWTRMLEAFATGCPEYMPTLPPPRIISDETLIDAEQRVLLRLAAQGPSVIVGRGGFHALQGQACLLNVFVHAPRKIRIRRMIRYYGAADERAAEEMIDRSDADRERYIAHLSGGSWYDVRQYHLAIDMALVGFDAAEQIIVSLAERLRCGQPGGSSHDAA